MDQVFILAEIRHFLVQVVYRSIEIACTVHKHILSLVAACLVVENDNNHVPINFLALSSQLFKQLLGPLQVFEGGGRFLISQVINCILVEFEECRVQVRSLRIFLDVGIFAHREVIDVSWVLHGLLLLCLKLRHVLLLQNQLHDFRFTAAVRLLYLVQMFGQCLRDNIERSIFLAVRGFPRC